MSEKTVLEVWMEKAMQLADEYAQVYDNHQNIEEGAEQAKRARDALQQHLQKTISNSVPESPHLSS